MDSLAKSRRARSPPDSMPTVFLTSSPEKRKAPRRLRKMCIRDRYYIEASGKRIEGLGIMGHYTLNQENNRYIGDIKIHNEEFNETYYGFENHQGRTFLAENEKPLGKVVYGNGNNKEDGCEGVHYKNVFGSYFHGPILSRNANLAYRLVSTALKNKYGKDLSLPAYEEILSLEQPEEYADVKSKAPAEQ